MAGTLLPPAAQELVTLGRELPLGQSDGFVMCNVALDGTADELGVGCCNLWVQPCGSGQSLSRGVQAYLADPLGVAVGQIPIMLTFPSEKDRAWRAAHPTRGTCQMLALAPFEWFAKHVPSDRRAARHAPPNVDRPEQEAYDVVKKAWVDRCLEALHARFPKTMNRVAFANLSTPATIEHYLPSGSGSAIGLDVTPDRFVNEEALQLLDMRTRLPGLWLTGQDVLCCGQPLAQASGIITALRVAGPLRATGLVLRLALMKILPP